MCDTSYPWVRLLVSLDDPLERVLRHMFYRFIGKSLYRPWLRRMFVSPRLILFGLVLCEEYECPECTPDGKWTLHPVLSRASLEDSRLMCSSRFHTDPVICFYTRGCCQCIEQTSMLDYYGLPSVFPGRAFRNAIHGLWKSATWEYRTTREFLHRIIHECCPLVSWPETIQCESELSRFGHVPPTLLNHLRTQQLGRTDEFTKSVLVGEYTHCRVYKWTPLEEPSLLRLVLREAENENPLAMQDAIQLFLTGAMVFEDPDLSSDSIDHPSTILYVPPDDSLALAWYAKYRFLFMPFHTTHFFESSKTVK